MADLSIAKAFMSRRAPARSWDQAYTQTKKMAGDQALSDIMANSAMSGDVKDKAVMSTLAGYNPLGALELQRADKQAEYDRGLDAQKLEAKANTANDKNKLFARLNGLQRARNTAVTNKSTQDTINKLDSYIEGISDELREEMPSYNNAMTRAEEIYTFKNNSGAGETTAQTADTTESDASTLPQGITIEDGAVYKNNTIAPLASQWYKLTNVDGADKPELLYDGLVVDNMPATVRKLYDKNLENWNRNNKSARASSKASQAQAQSNKQGKQVATDYFKTLSGVKKQLGSMSTSIKSLINKYNRGDYALANFTDLKNTMADGRMTESDVSIALGLGEVDGIMQGIISRISDGNIANTKLRDKKTAGEGINRLVNKYNAMYQAVVNPQFEGEYAEVAQREYSNRSPKTYFQNLEPSFNPVNMGDDNKGGPAGPIGGPNAKTYSLPNGKSYSLDQAKSLLAKARSGDFGPMGNKVIDAFKKQGLE